MNDGTVPFDKMGEDLETCKVGILFGHINVAITRGSLALLENYFILFICLLITFSHMTIPNFKGSGEMQC